MNLCDAAIGAALTVEHIGGERSFRRRLMELGLVPGTRVEILGAAPFGGPIELLARGCSLSIRREEAASVVVASLEATHPTANPALKGVLSAAIVTSPLGGS
jgi:ferrous iron transport protein A